LDFTGDDDSIAILRFTRPRVAYADAWGGDQPVPPRRRTSPSNQDTEDFDTGA
jgi:hypothetical protein